MSPERLAIWLFEPGKNLSEVFESRLLKAGPPSQPGSESALG
jgi:hypothetical protein